MADELVARLETLALLDDDVAKAKTLLDSYKARRDEERGSILALMRERETDSVRTAKATVTIGRRTSIKIVDPSMVKKWLVTNDLDAEHYFVPDRRAIESLGKSVLDGSGEIIDGCIVEQSEYLSVKKKEAKDGRSDEA